MPRRLVDKSEEMKTKTENMLPKMLSGSVHKEFKKCGKPNCKCITGELHGPYYYHFVRAGGELRKRYLKASEVEPTIRACLLRHKLESEHRACSGDAWQKFRELRIEIREAGNFSK
jgi:hypothetical protein